MARCAELQIGCQVVVFGWGCQVCVCLLSYLHDCMQAKMYIQLSIRMLGASHQLASLAAHNACTLLMARGPLAPAQTGGPRCWVWSIAFCAFNWKHRDLHNNNQDASMEPGPPRVLPQPLERVAAVGRESPAPLARPLLLHRDWSCSPMSRTAGAARPSSL